MEQPEKNDLSQLKDELCDIFKDVPCRLKSPNSEESTKKKGYITNFFQSVLEKELQYNNKLILSNLKLDTATDLLVYLRSIEAQIYQFINKKVESIDSSGMVSQFFNKTDVKTCIDILRKADICLLKHHRAIFSKFESENFETAQKIERILENIFINPGDLAHAKREMEPAVFDKCCEEQNKFLIEMKDFILISFIRLSECDDGLKAINIINKILDSEEFLPKDGRALINIKVNYLDMMGSAKLYGYGYEYNAEDKEPLLTKRDKLTLPLEERVAHYIKGKQGAKSLMAFPIWSKIYGTPASDIALAFFEDEGAMEHAFVCSLSGSFSINSSNKMFYIPAHIELFHEFTHIISNAEAENLQHIKVFTTEEKQTWTDAEEHKAIRGKVICENRVSEFFGTSISAAHCGVSSIYVLMPKFLKQDLRIIEKKPMDSSSEEKIIDSVNSPRL